MAVVLKLAQTKQYDKIKQENIETGNQYNRHQKQQIQRVEGKGIETSGNATYSSTLKKEAASASETMVRKTQCHITEKKLHQTNYSSTSHYTVFNKLPI